MNEERVENYLAKREFYEGLPENEILYSIDADMIIQTVILSSTRLNSLRSSFKD
jgi:hypothetical protein